MKSAAKYGVKAGAFILVLSAIMILFVIVAFVPCMLPGEGTIIGGIKVSVTIALFIAMFVLSLPVAIALPAYFFEKGKPWHCALYGYKKGLKIWGKIFCLGLLVLILEVVLMFILYMPSLTMISSYHAATLSQMNGDTVLFPGGFSFWYFCVLFGTHYLLSIIMWIGNASYAYLYASIKSDEIEEAKNLYKI